MRLRAALLDAPLAHSACMERAPLTGALLVCLQAYRGKPAAKGADKKPAKFELTEEQKQEIREAFELFDTGAYPLAATAATAGNGVHSK